MDFISPLIEQSPAIPYLVGGGIAMILLSLFRLLRRVCVIGSAVVGTPVYLFQSGSLSAVQVGGSINSEVALFTLIAVLTLSVLLGFTMPVSMHGKSRIVPKGTGAFGCCLVMGVMALVLMHSFSVFRLTAFQEVASLTFIAGVASGFCVYSFLRFVDAVLPLLGWGAVVTALFLVVSPKVTSTKSLSNTVVDSMDTRIFDEIEHTVGRYFDGVDLSSAQKLEEVINGDRFDDRVADIWVRSLATDVE